MRYSDFDFLSTSPAWGTTHSNKFIIVIPRLSIHVPRVGDDAPLNDAYHAGIKLSIHVPRVGDDGAPCGSAGGRQRLSIHVPRVGDDGFL